jgi:amino acid transporter
LAEETFLSPIKRLIVGAPIPSHLAHRERFSRVTGLAVLSSDPLSSVAYATEEILRVLTLGGIADLSLVTPIGAVIATMLAIVVFSYRQTIHAYPSGGGAYIVAKHNLDRLPSVIAAASLLIDYVLTVFVSIAGAANNLADSRTPRRLPSISMPRPPFIGSSCRQHRSRRPRIGSRSTVR